VDSIPTEKGVRIKLRFAVEIDNIVLPLLPKRRLVVLSRDSSEFAVCAELLAFEARPFHVDVTCVERLENLQLEAQFEARLVELRDPQHRIRLLHYSCVTTKSQTIAVCKHGFHEELWEDGEFGRGVRVNLSYTTSVHLIHKSSHTQLM
jgi:hypothetical protein